MRSQHFIYEPNCLLMYMRLQEMLDQRGNLITD
jgi:hypothetical protein